MNSTLMRPAVVVLTVSAAVLVGIVAAGGAGALVASWLITIIAMIVIRRRLATTAHPRRMPRAPSWPWDAYPAYRRIEFSLSWGASGRSSRALIRRVARTVLAQSCGIDLDREPDAARRVLGATSWSALEPTRHDSAEQGEIDDRCLDALVTRLTDLATAPASPAHTDPARPAPAQLRAARGTEPRS